MAAGGNALLPNFLSNFLPESRLRSVNLYEDSGEFLFDVSVHGEGVEQQSYHRRRNGIS